MTCGQEMPNALDVSPIELFQWHYERDPSCAEKFLHAIFDKEEEMSVRAKFYVAEKTEYPGGSTKLVMRAVSRGDVNAVWSSATPSGTLEMNITNRPAFDQMELGAEYLITFEKAAPAELADGHEWREDVRSIAGTGYSGSCGECGMGKAAHDEPERSKLVAQSRGTG